MLSYPKGSLGYMLSKESVAGRESDEANFNNIRCPDIGCIFQQKGGGSITLKETEACELLVVKAQLLV